MRLIFEQKYLIFSIIVFPQGFGINQKRIFEESPAYAGLFRIY